MFIYYHSNIQSSLSDFSTYLFKLIIERPGSLDQVDTTIIKYLEAITYQSKRYMLEGQLCQVFSRLKYMIKLIVLEELRYVF